MIPSTRHTRRASRVQMDSQIRHWPLDDLASGTVRDLSPYRATDATFSAGLAYGRPGTGNGRTAVAFSGTDTHVLVGTAAFGALWNGDTGSAIAWAKNTGIWTTDTVARYPFHIRSTADSTYYIRMGKSATANTLVWQRRSGGTIIELTTAASTTDWFCMGLTWDVATKTVKAYLDGVLVGSSANNVNFTAWGVNLPSGGESVLFAGSVTLQEWVGGGGPVAVWAGAVLSDAEMRYLARR